MSVCMSLRQSLSLSVTPLRAISNVYFKFHTIFRKHPPYRKKHAIYLFGRIDHTIQPHTTIPPNPPVAHIVSCWLLTLNTTKYLLSFHQLHVMSVILLIKYFVSMAWLDASETWSQGICNKILSILLWSTDLLLFDALFYFYDNNNILMLNR